MHDKLANGWTISDANDLYDLSRWGNGYFSIGANGQLQVHPSRKLDQSLDLKDLVDRLRERGLQLPILIRFNGILEDRVRELHDVFARKISENEYRGRYYCVYPIKVNQQRQVVEEILSHGSPLGFGLEAGSKPELLAVVAMTTGDTPIICNGFKDQEFIEMAMLASKIGRNVIPVVEKFTELGLILEQSRKLGVRPQIGMRVKLAARGSGRWQSSGGFRSKFGLTVQEILEAVKVLEKHDMLDCFRLLHFHLGSQITNIRHVKAALNEAARIYVDLARRNTGLTYLDVGGGLGVDYDGTQTNFESSMNYTLEEYAADVVYQIQSVCDDAGVPHPHIVSESGRAVAAFHSVLVFNVLGVAGQGDTAEMPKELKDLPEDPEQPLKELMWTLRDLSMRNLRESFHDATQSLETAMSLFGSGYLTLEQRSLVENLFFTICRRIQKMTEDNEDVPEELEGLDSMLSDTYFCNFSLFQSMPDSWAIKQLFPVMPIHRLKEEPTRHAVLGDITCDSDGKIDRFIGRRDVKRTLLLHPFDGSDYILGAFLIGAYQEILGDLHNLFGDTNAVHVSLNDENQVVLETIIKGETVGQVLEYVQFKDKDLVDRLQSAVERAVREGKIDNQEAGRFVEHYERGLRGYTYLGDQSTSET
ncbi:MAG: biosynthetic arginine decarboxylase [Planctomycetales bacterium]|nr:biosynthetic arginine decarboxylase [Planctomycetales bacterium]